MTPATLETVTRKLAEIERRLQELEGKQAARFLKQQSQLSAMHRLRKAAASAEREYQLATRTNRRLL